MDFWIYSIISMIYIILVLWMAIDLSRTKRWLQYPLLLLLVTLSLAYDNGIIAAGEAISEGNLLMTLSSLRFWLHAFVTPTLVLAGYYILQRSGVRWGRKMATQIAAWLITAGLIIYQIVSSTLAEVQHLTLTVEYGVMRYSAEGQAGPPIMVIIVGIILLVIGILVLVKQKWAWLLVGTALLFIGQLIPIPIESSAATNVFELILILSIWLTIRHQDRNPA
ncbi:hypothetical protein ACFSVM_07450 [Paenibacillus shunpengii]|uniref:Phospholipid phosphatase n=1 Tax=Paenibacillus shunpengii TaxID=2054424 RepID=A0ABW5SKK4_9BACL